MKLPKPRNLIIGIVIGLIVVGVGLVLAQDQETLRVRTSIAAEDPRFPAYLAKLSGQSLTASHRSPVLTDGPAAFSAMLAAINAARHRVAFEGYVYSSKRVIGRRFSEA